VKADEIDRRVARAREPRGLASLRAKLLEEYASRLGLGDKARGNARELLAKCERQMNLSGYRPGSIVAAILYISSALAGERRTGLKIREATGVTEPTMRVHCRRICEKFDPPVSFPRTTPFDPKSRRESLRECLSLIGASPKVRARAWGLLETCERMKPEFLFRRRPRSVAAAIAYIALYMEGGGASLPNIGSKLDVSEATIGSICGSIRGALGIPRRHAVSSNLTTVSLSGTVPVATQIVRELGLERGQRVKWHARGGKIVGTPLKGKARAPIPERVNKGMKWARMREGQLERLKRLKEEIGGKGNP